jgi:hypothetical protein
MWRERRRIAASRSVTAGNIWIYVDDRRIGPRGDPTDLPTRGWSTADDQSVLWSAEAHKIWPKSISWVVFPLTSKRPSTTMICV